MKHTQIVKVIAREILDSRGVPTVEATVCLDDGTTGVASVPSGASTGQFEACELRDNGRSRYGGRGVTDAVRHVNKLISPAISGVSVFAQKEIDSIIRSLDGTENKSKLGANAILAVSLAVAHAAANVRHEPLYRYLGGCTGQKMPIPMMNILNGGAHAANNVDIQEFMILPVGAATFAEAMRMGCEIYAGLGKLLRSKNLSTTVGDEGGYAPNLHSDEEAIELLCRAISDAGYDEDSIKIALDAASSEWVTDSGDYLLPKRDLRMTNETLIRYWESFVRKYPIISIEDGLGENDFFGWQMLTRSIGEHVMLVGDDLFVTNTVRLKMGIDSGAANAILIKPNQIGTLSETLEVITLAQRSGYRYILSHRSGETIDTTIADLAVATNAGYIKAGAPARGERIAKYNRLLEIETYAGGFLTC